MLENKKIFETTNQEKSPYAKLKVKVIGPEPTGDKIREYMQGIRENKKLSPQSIVNSAAQTGKEMREQDTGRREAFIGQEILDQKNLHLSGLGKELLTQVYPDGSKLSFDQRGVNPVVLIAPDAETVKFLDGLQSQSFNKIAAIASSGNMPDWWALPEWKTKNIDQVLQAIQESENEKLKSRTPRFIDTKDQYDKARNAIRSHVLRVVGEHEAQGAEQITFSVCSAAAGFDMMLVSVLRELIENGKKNITILITLPFDKEAVRGYSISVGLQQETYQEMYQWLLDNDVKVKQNGSVAFLMPTVIPYMKEHEGMGAPNVDQIHQLSTLVNGDANQVYVDVNNAIFRYAHKLSGENGLSVMVFDQGKAVQDLLGGARHMLAMAQRVGVPMSSEDNRIMVVQDGIVAPVPYTPEIYNGLGDQYGPTLNKVDATAAKLQATMEKLNIKI
jgi:hypothetical protein